MARPLVIPPHLPFAELERRYRGARDAVARSHLPIVWLLASGTPTAAVARVTGYSAPRVRAVARCYHAGGVVALIPVPRRCLARRSRRGFPRRARRLGGAAQHGPYRLVAD